MTLAFEDSNLTLLDVVCVADVDAEERDDDSLVEIIPYNCHFFYTDTIFGAEILHRKNA